MKKKISIILLMMMLGVMFTGCTGRQHFDINVGTGDTISVDLRQTANERFVLTNDQIKITDGSDETLMYGLFMSEDTFTRYYKSIHAIGEQLEEENSVGLFYQVYQYENTDNIETIEYFCWLPGSNTGFILDSAFDKDKADSIFSKLTFSIKKTEQKDSTYIPELKTASEDYEIITH